MNSKTHIFFLLINLLIALSFQSCKKDYTSPPEIPIIESFIADFSVFPSNKLLYQNFSVNIEHSAININLWKDLITDSLAIPTASYIEVFKDHNPIYQSDNTWLWEYSFDVEENSFTAKLFGKSESEKINWKMFITKDGDYDDFLWCTGISNVDKNENSWILFDKPENDVEFLSIEYFGGSNNTENIKYMNVVPGGTENGSYIIYGNDSETDFNSYFYIYNKGQDNLIEIEWDQITKNGRVKDEIKFGDTDWHCWNKNLEDIDCE